MLVNMESLPGEAEAAERLKSTSLRDFGIPPEGGDDDVHRRLPTYKVTILRAPVPDLYKYALNLIGCPAYGPGEKVLWWVNFSYRGEECTLTLEKFGLRIYLRTDRSETTRWPPIRSLSNSGRP